MQKQTTMKKLLLISAVFLGLTVAYGQKQGNIWYFGDSAGIDFNTGSPTALLNGQLAFPIGQSHNEGTSAISDSSGSILFYSDGMTVWNKNNQIMQNGTGLFGNFSSTQSSIIVPDPANSNRYYYLFTVSSGFCCGGNISDGLRYSRVDMCLDSSKGGVIPIEKNIKVIDTVAEKIAVTRHSNGIDYWILTHKFYSNEFWALHLTATGIIDTVVTAIGTSHTGSIAGSQGQLKFSQNGQKIAIGATNGLNLLEIFAFDITTGVVSNCQSLNRIDNGSVYGVEFSPDGSILYSLSSSFSPFGMDIGQYDLNAGSLAAINASLISVYNETTAVTGRGLQIGSDGKIYLVSILNSGTLSVINNPNVYGVGCNYQNQIISLGGKQGSYSLPSFIAGFDYSNGLIQCDQSGISENTFNKYLTIYPNPFSSTTTLQTDNIFHNAVLTVYNSHGQTVKQIDNLSGQTIIFQRDNLSSGLYFLRLTGDNTIFYAGKLVITD
ncbi:MAG: T9SS type A sorting domain-containing protein [Nitrosopumilus sp.]|jgi:hypothetical protein|nr:T9SS type A sorting domain-containing protein [Nitrosopumilus sp.]